MTWNRVENKSESKAWVNEKENGRIEMFKHKDGDWEVIGFKNGEEVASDIYPTLKKALGVRKEYESHIEFAESKLTSKKKLKKVM